MNRYASREEEEEEGRRFLMFIAARIEEDLCVARESEVVPHLFELA